MKLNPRVKASKASTGHCPLLGRALASSAALLLTGCFFELPPVELEGGQTNAGGTTNTGGVGMAGIPGAGAPGGGQGGTAGMPPITECPEGFVDCDDDLSNGCEGDFRLAPANPTETINVYNTTLRVVLDGSGEEWTGIPLLPLTETCDGCTIQDNNPVVDSRLPLPGDLTAGFRFSWDAQNLYFWYQAYDDEIISDSAERASRQDGVELVIDGGEERGGGGPDDHQIFIAVNGNKEETSRAAPAPLIDLETRTVGTHCYYVEAALGFTFIAGLAEQPQTGMADMELGIDVATNDHDANEDGNPERQSQIFFRDPGADYWFAPSPTLGSIVLHAGTPPASAP